jgi:hypothetical protein
VTFENTPVPSRRISGSKERLICAALRGRPLCPSGVADPDGLERPQRVDASNSINELAIEHSAARVLDIAS